MARTMAEPDRLDALVERLERTAAELRAGELSTERAAALVDDCARIAAEAGAELDRRVRAADAGPGVGRPARARVVSTRSRPRAEAAAYPDHLRDQVEDYLAGLRFATEPAAAGLEEAMRYSLLAGGKRIRPVLALATASATGRDPAEVLPLAAALELIHTYSLIHDDLPAMDDDELRRGRPTCHVKFGEDVAILAGDGLYAEAFRLVLHEQQGDPASILAAVSRAGRRHRRQRHGRRPVHRRPRARARRAPRRCGRLHELKTGRLIGASVECVLLLTGREDQASTLPHFRNFAAELGVLFQIVDDILDVTGTDDALGKPRGSDERHGKVTYVTQYGLDGARELAAESHRNARGALAQAAPGGAEELEHITDFIFTRPS